MPKIRFLKVDIFVALKAFLPMQNISKYFFQFFFLTKKKGKKFKFLTKIMKLTLLGKWQISHFLKVHIFYSLESFCIDLEH